MFERRMKDLMMECAIENAAISIRVKEEKHMQKKISSSTTQQQQQQSQQQRKSSTRRSEKALSKDYSFLAELEQGKTSSLLLRRHASVDKHFERRVAVSERNEIERQLVKETLKNLRKSHSMDT